ncbi:MAG: hypothetical protein J7647_23145 [Cyanobacteria bacterium SBLK]|nr:hypothetical protein [Cyanobacteria bacterium SBLK]
MQLNFYVKIIHENNITMNPSKFFIVVFILSFCVATIDLIYQSRKEKKLRENFNKIRKNWNIQDETLRFVFIILLILSTISLTYFAYLFDEKILPSILTIASGWLGYFISKQEDKAKAKQKKADEIVEFFESLQDFKDILVDLNLYIKM